MNLLNPYRNAIKKWLIDIMGNKYNPHDPIAERLSYLIVNPKDTEDFGKLIAQIFECGYLKCLNDYKSQLEKLNIKVRVIPEKQN